MEPQTDRILSLDEPLPAPSGLLDAQWLADLEEDRRLERELLEAELGGEG